MLDSGGPDGLDCLLSLILDSGGPEFRLSEVTHA